MPDHDWFDNIDPITKLWLYESWQQDLIDQNEFAKNYSIFVGSFSNPKMAQQILSSERPENNSVSSDEDFEESTNMVIRDRERYLKKLGKGKQTRRRMLRRQLLKE